MEIWKEVAGYEGLYLVSNEGCVKSVDRTVMYAGKIKPIKGRVLTQYRSNVPYFRVCLYKEGKRNQELVHRLVLTAFTLNPDNKPIVNHIDNNPQNNNLSNLEWATWSENAKYAYDQKRMISPFARMGKEYYTNKNLRLPVISTNIATGAEVVYESISDASRRGYISSCISRCCRGKLNKHAGLLWRYASPAELARLNEEWGKK